MSGVAGEKRGGGGRKEDKTISGSWELLMNYLRIRAPPLNRRIYRYVEALPAPFLKAFPRGKPVPRPFFFLLPTR